MFALTRAVRLMEDHPDPESLVRGLLVLALLWWAWCAFIWLGNSVRLDRGYALAGSLAAMAGLFVAALVIPFAWEARPGGLNFALILAVAFAAVRASYVATFFVNSRPGSRQRTQVLIDTIPQSISCVMLVLGALLGDMAQTVLWACAFAVDFGGGWLLSRFNGWRVSNPRHFVERHGLVLIIALGETLISTGSGIGSWSGPLDVVAAVLGLALAIALWFSFFGGLANAAERTIVAANPTRRPALARDAYTLGNFPMIVGIVYSALGLTLVLHDVDRMPAQPARTLALATLTGGICLYFLGLALFQRITLGSIGVPQLSGAAATVLAGVVASRAPGPVTLALLVGISVATSLACAAEQPTNNARERGAVAGWQAVVIERKTPGSLRDRGFMWWLRPASIR